MHKTKIRAQQEKMCEQDHIKFIPSDIILAPRPFNFIVLGEAVVTMILMLNGSRNRGGQPDTFLMHTYKIYFRFYLLLLPLGVLRALNCGPSSQ